MDLGTEMKRNGGEKGVLLEEKYAFHAGSIN
jgi:hypothetical protein